MHKGHSDSAQSRARRAVIHSSKNAGLDQGVFRYDDDEREQMVNEKRELEDKLRMLSARIQRAKAEVWVSGKYAPPGAFERWNAERAKLLTEVKKRDDYLRRSKSKRDDFIHSTLRDYSQHFHDVAKLMLAHEVYERLQIAALHRATEANLQKRAEEKK